VTYKADCADQRESPSKPIARHLRELGADVHYHDPFVPQWSFNGTTLQTERDLAQSVRESDITILLQAHEPYLCADLGDMSKPVLDTRGVLSGMSVTTL
jgi:UDP-N-acetyl-D-mannosaminuronate dehydrogenase